MLGFDVHFLRYVHLSIFDHRTIDPSKLVKNTEDLALLFLVIVPLYIYALKFWTSPVYINYTSKMNSLLLPFSMMPMFLSYNIDIILLGILVFVMNFLVFCYHVDPSTNMYQLVNQRIRGRNIKDNVYD